MGKYPPEGVFWDHVDQSGDCWEWTGRRNRGYGVLSVGQSVIVAHRWAYKLMVGPLPERKKIGHYCENRACVNPAHLALSRRSVWVSR